MNEIDLGTIGIALITRYPKWYDGKLRSIRDTDKVRGDLALQFIREATKRGCSLVVVEGESSLHFYEALKTFENDHVHIVKRQVKKRSPSKRLAIKKLMEDKHIKAIIPTEAEKFSLITDCLSALVAPVLSNNADIVIPKREENLFKLTYSGYMYVSELEGNRLYNELLKTNGLLPKTIEDLDMFFGPRVIKNEKKIVNLFLKRYSFQIGETEFPREYFDPEQLSGTTFFPIVQALKNKLRVTSIEVPFRYPKLQKENEETGVIELFIEKRRAQRLGLLVELMHFVSFLEREKTSGIKLLV